MWFYVWFLLVGWLVGLWCKNFLFIWVGGMFVSLLMQFPEQLQKYQDKINAQNRIWNSMFSYEKYSINVG